MRIPHNCSNGGYQQISNLRTWINQGTNSFEHGLTMDLIFDQDTNSSY